MKAQTAPTSPKYRAEQAKKIGEIWKQPEFQQPVRLPWGRLVVLAMVTGLLAGAGGLWGWSWLVRMYPESQLAAWWPQVNQTTTVVQPGNDRNPLPTPAAVERAAEAAMGLVVTQADDTVYSADMVVGTAALLSDNGWAVAHEAARPSGETRLTVWTANQTGLSVNRIVDDSATPFLFFRLEAEANERPITLAAGNGLKGNERVWVISRVGAEARIVARQLAGSAGPRWESSDVLERYYLLDPRESVAPGALVVQSNGAVIGLADSDGRVWPVNSIDRIIRDLIQKGSFERPALGLRAMDRAVALTVSLEERSGKLIGASGDEPGVRPKGPADAGGLRSGDALIAINQQPFTDAVFQMLQRFRPGETIQLSYVRGGQTRTAPVKLEILRP